MTMSRGASTPKRSPSTRPRRRAQPWVVRDPAVLRLAFQTFENLTTLRRHCVEAVEYARNYQSMYRNRLVRPDQTGLRRWRQMLDQVTRCWCVLDDLVRTNRLHATRCHEVYLDLLGIQVTWQHIDGPAHLRALIAQTIDHVRQLRIQHAQRPYHQG